MKNPKFNVGDKVVVCFHKQHGEVLEVLLREEWKLPVIGYKIKVDVGTVTVDEKWVDPA